MEENKHKELEQSLIECAKPVMEAFLNDYPSMKIEARFISVPFMARDGIIDCATFDQQEGRFISISYEVWVTDKKTEHRQIKL